MKIIFFGSGKFAVTILEALCSQKQEILLVVTKPDKQKGRHLHLSATPVKEYTLKYHLELFQPMDVNLPENARILKNKSADIFVVVSYGKILSHDILALPALMPVNIHASLLPGYRGAAPINRALMNGEKTTGVTFIRMNEHMDRGDILFQRSLKITKKDNVFTLEERLSELASGSIKNILQKIQKGSIKAKKQNDKKATYAPMLAKQDGLIRWDTPAKSVYDHFKGCYGWPGSFTLYKSKLLKILDMETCSNKIKGNPGEIIATDKNLLEVACSCGTICIKEVLPESHKRMPVSSFLAGHHVKPGDVLGF